MPRSRTRTLLATSLLTAAIAATADPFDADPSDADAIRERLAASEAAERRVRDDFAARVAAGGVSAAERAEYAAYLERLRAQVDALRAQQARLHGAPVAATAAEVAAARAPQSADERVRSLEASLGESLGVFDEMLLREHEELARRRASSASSSASSSAGSSASAADSAASASSGGWLPPEGTGDGAETEAARGGLARAGSGTGSPLPGAADRTPPDVADGRDDDVVARQLREAAQSEPDPALRERLWDEYRRYKASSR